MHVMLYVVPMEFHLFEMTFQFFGRHHIFDTNLDCPHALWATIILIAKYWVLYIFLQSILLSHQHVPHSISMSAHAPRCSAEESHMDPFYTIIPQAIGNLHLAQLIAYFVRY